MGAAGAVGAPGPQSPASLLAVVRVEVPAGVAAEHVEAELTRALHAHPKRPVSAELTLADGTGPWPRSGPARYAFVAVLTLPGDRVPHRLARKVGKVGRKALEHRFGQPAGVHVRTELSDAEAGAFWCSLRGTPHRPG